MTQTYNTKEEWKALKANGSVHYRTGDIEPIDLYKSAGTLKPWAINNIIKCAFRNVHRPIVEKDLDKIIHYCEMLRVLCHEGE